MCSILDFYEEIGCGLVVLYSLLLHDVFYNVLSTQKTVDLIGQTINSVLCEIWTTLARYEEWLYLPATVLVIARTTQAFAVNFENDFGLLICFNVLCCATYKLKSPIFKYELQPFVLSLAIMYLNYVDEPISKQIMIKAVYTMLFVKIGPHTVNRYK